MHITSHGQCIFHINFNSGSSESIEDQDERSPFAPVTSAAWLGRVSLLEARSLANLPSGSTPGMNKVGSAVGEVSVDALASELQWRGRVMPSNRAEHRGWEPLILQLQ